MNNSDLLKIAKRHIDFCDLLLADRIVKDITRVILAFHLYEAFKKMCIYSLLLNGISFDEDMSLFKLIGKLNDCKLYCPISDSERYVIQGWGSYIEYGLYPDYQYSMSPIELDVLDAGKEWINELQFEALKTIEK